MDSPLDGVLLKDFTEESFCLVGLDLNLVTFNRRFREMYFDFFGVEVSEGQSILDFAQAHRRDLVRGIYEKVFEGAELESEIEVPDTSGTVHAFRVKYKPVVQGEAILGAFVSAIDITEIRASTQKFQASEKRFRALVEHSGDAVAVISPLGQPLYASPSVYRVLGYTEQEVLGLNMFDILHPDDAPGIAPLMEQVLVSPGVPLPGITARVRHKDGSWRWLEATVINMIHDPDIGGIVDNFRDVTGRFELQERLRLSEEQFRGAFQHSAVGMALISPEGAWKEVNRSVLDFLGYTAKELRGLTFQDITHPDDLGADLDHLKALVEGRIASYQMEKRYFHKKGHIVWGLLSVSKVTDDKGRLIHFISQIQDISDHVRVREELKRRAEELALSNAELEQFAYIASHDLQEPLRMVTGFLSQLQKRYEAGLDEKARQYIHFAMDGALRMRKILLDLLEYSRVGRRSSDWEDIDMNALLAEVVRMQQTSVNETGARVEWGEFGVIRAARTPMLQLFQNLIGNALKYHRGDVPPRVQIQMSETANYWQFSVKDNGIGIDPVFYDKIFIIFQRLHSRDEFSGTGIGLAICKKIVENHNGKIWVRSTLGEGSIFSFTIGKQLG